MAPQGSFSNTFSANLLRPLCDENKSGELNIHGMNNDTKIFFRNGKIIYAAGSKQHTRLSGFLKKHAVISPEQLRECLSAIKNHEEFLGMVIVEKGILSTEQLNECSSKLTEEILYDVLLDEQGEYEYRYHEHNQADMPSAELNSRQMILEASQRIFEVSLLTDELPVDGQVFAPAPKNADKKKRTDTQQDHREILALVDGVKTVEQIVRQSKYPTLHVYKTLYFLFSHGLIVKSQDNGQNYEKVMNDCPGIVAFYASILNNISKNLSRETGSGAIALFEESKFSLRQDILSFIGHYYVDNSPAENTGALLSRLRTNGSGDKADELLINGFNEYCRQIFTRSAVTLGAEPTRVILRETNKSLERQTERRAYPPQLENKLSGKMREILAEVDETIEAWHAPDKQNDGFFTIMLDD